MRQRELGVRHIGFVSLRCREGVRRVEANVDLTRRALNGTIRGVNNGRPWQVRSLRVRRHEARSAAWWLSSGRMMDLSDYTLEPLHEDAQLILYQAVHASPADAVACSVLVVEPAGEYVSRPARRSCS